MSTVRETAPWFSRTMRRAFWPSLARRCGFESRFGKGSLQVPPRPHLDGGIVARKNRVTSAKFCMFGPKTTGLPSAAGSMGFWPP